MLIPMTNVDDIQGLIFILAYKLRQPEDEIMKMPFWVAKKRSNQYKDFQKAMEKEMNKGNKDLK